MKINFDGTVDFEQVVIAPSTTRSEFLMSSLGEKAEKVMDSGEWLRVRVKGENVIAALVFKNERLFELHLCLADQSSDGWGAWSPEGELVKKMKHDEFLKINLGQPPYQFKWGKVESITDVKAGGSEIVLRYL